jgi:hypothetical protein
MSQSADDGHCAQSGTPKVVVLIPSPRILMKVEPIEFSFVAERRVDLPVLAL